MKKKLIDTIVEENVISSLIPDKITNVSPCYGNVCFFISLKIDLHSNVTSDQIRPQFRFLGALYQILKLLRWVHCTKCSYDI